MKILHALVGYLAVTALPFQCFHPFASPLAAIDYYDGYVDTTQNHSGSAVLKYEPGDIKEARQATVPVELIPEAAAVIAIVVGIYLSIYWIHEDDPVRGNDVEFLVLVEHFY